MNDFDEYDVSCNLEDDDKIPNLLGQSNKNSISLKPSFLNFQIPDFNLDCLKFDEVRRKLGSIENSRKRVLNNSDYTPVKKLSNHDWQRLRSGSSVCSYHNIVEELISNSIDAKSTVIEIVCDPYECSVEVIDNGHGIQYNDLDSIGLWNYTSKINSKSLNGFKGEALASISQLSKVRINTKSKLGESTFSVEIANGISKITSARDRNLFGTTVSVSEIFHNLPVRRSAMKWNIEMNLLKEYIQKMAVLHYSVSWSLSDVSQSRRRCQIFQVSPQASVLAQFNNFYSADIANKLREVHVEKGNWKLEGLISNLNSESCVCTKDYQHIYVNNRWMRRFEAITYAINDFFKSFLGYRSKGPMKKHFQYNDRIPWIPCFVLRLVCPIESYDVISESDKSVAVFEDESILRHLVSNLVELLKSTALSDTSLDTKNLDETKLLNATPKSNQNLGFSNYLLGSSESRDRNLLHTSTFSELFLKSLSGDISPISPNNQEKFTDNMNGSYGIPLFKGPEVRNISHEIEKKCDMLLDEENKISKTWSRETTNFTHLRLNEESNYVERQCCFKQSPYFTTKDSGYENSLINQGYPIVKTTGKLFSSPISISRDILKSMSLIGQVDSKYLLFYSGNSVIAVDQHAADERVRYEALVAAENREPIFAVVRYVITVNNPEDIYVLENYSDIITKWGFRYHFNPQSDKTAFKILNSCELDKLRRKTRRVTITQTPVLSDEPLTSSDFIEYIKFIGSNYDMPADILDPPAINRILASKACRQSIKFGMKLSQNISMDLIKRLSNTSQPFQCAHGRPTIFPIASIDVE